MKNEPIFELIPGSITLEEQALKVYFDNLINYLQNHHNDEDDSDYVTDDSDEDDNSLGSL